MHIVKLQTVATALFFGIAAVGAYAQTSTLTAAQQARQVGGCPIYPSDNIWNTPIANLPADPQSSVYINAAGSGSPLHADFGHDASNGIPINVISSSAARVKMQFDDPDDSDPGKYPIGAQAKVEAGSDHHLLQVVSSPRCTLYEMFAVNPVKNNGTVGRNGNGTVSAYEGNFVDLTSNQLRPIPPGSTTGINSADAAGLEIMPALVRYDEVASGQILHALRFTLPQTRAAFVWPARHFASSSNNPALLPMGARLRLKAGVNISSFSAANQVLLTAMKTYGIILADNGSTLFVSGTPDSRWNDDDLNKLKAITLNDFEVVSMDAIGRLQYLNNSGKVDPADEPAK